MKKYYLVPFETDSSKMITDTQPKYLDLLGVASGLQPKVIEKLGATVTKWQQKYYIVCVERENESDFLEIEKMKDIVNLYADTDLSLLSEKDIDISKVVTRDDMDKAVTKWLTDEESILSEKLNPVGIADGIR